VGPRAVLDTVRKRKILSSCRVSKRNAELKIYNTVFLRTRVGAKTGQWRQKYKQNYSRWGRPKIRSDGLRKERIHFKVTKNRTYIGQRFELFDHRLKIRVAVAQSI
jgi:hypothetical protein